MAEPVFIPESKPAKLERTKENSDSGETFWNPALRVPLIHPISTHLPPRLPPPPFTIAGSRGCSPLAPISSA
ncbi:hypothetical protein SDJN02_10180, partial [Cucurbita argyrosperma subsp. argyrosperma]